MAAPQRAHSSVLKDFDNLIMAYTYNGTRAITFHEECPFVSFPGFQKRLSDDFVNRLLYAVILDFNFRFYIDPSIVRTRYLRIFCILLSLKKGHLIINFIRSELHDDRLPFSLIDRPVDFSTDRDDPYLWENFCNKQWLFCAAEFKGYDIRLEKERILPIVEKVEVAVGENTTFYKVIIHEAYNLLRQTANYNQVINPIAPFVRIP
jgi:hypothetical protein